MGGNNKLRRSNMILVGLVILFLLYGIMYRVQSGDNKLYIFGYAIDLPFGTQQEAAAAEDAAVEEVPAEQDAAVEEVPAEK